jgi:hypothetical protein
MNWPNHEGWSAERSVVLKTDYGNRSTAVVQCGSLRLPSGRLVVCDPFAFLQPRDNAQIRVPPGNYPVTVTVADVSPNLDGSHLREAYATVRIAQREDAYRRILPLVREGESPPALADGEFIGFSVDAGTACFVDAEAVATCMPNPDMWYEGVFDNESEDCWFKKMDDPNHLREGLANIALPLARAGENIVIIHSGWGDGTYPVVGSFDAADRLIAVHIDFGVVP